jgi:glutamate 5-kinase
MSQLIYKPDLIARVRRIVVKVGSSVLSDGSGVRTEVVESIAGEIDALMTSGREAILVTSGAIAAGRSRIAKPTARADSLPTRQAAAAIGQIELMALYQREFARHGRTAAQLLLTHDDLADRKRRANARQTILTLLANGITPIVNENDTVAVDEIRFGDNDHLSALVANLADAELLVMLSDIEGVLTGDPRSRADARLIPLITDAEAEMKGLVADTAGPLGTGGMASKLKAARQAAGAGIAVLIVAGHRPDAITAALDATRESGTLILPMKSQIKGRKHWIAFALKPMGALTVDSGAAQALRTSGRSLLPSGIRGVSGEFSAGACVSLISPEGNEFGRGLVNYSAGDVMRVIGHRSAEILRLLGYKVADEIIHRDNLVLLDRTR